MVHHYPKISQSYKIESEGIYDGHLIIEEKVDGSQFRIGIRPDGIIECASHNSKDGEVLSSMFNLAIEKAHHIFAGYKPDVEMTIFCEYLKSPTHNTIKYERVPINNLILFDVKRGDMYLDRPQKEKFAGEHGIELVPLLWEGEGSTIKHAELDKMNEAFQDELLKHASILGHNEKTEFKYIEGFVVKNYGKLYDVNKFTDFRSSTHPWMCVKIVNEKFKEKNHDVNPNKTNKFQELKDNYAIEARMIKAINRGKEQGLLTGSMADLAWLIPDMKRDIVDEEGEGIKEALWNIFSGEILKNAGKLMPQVYKKYLEDNR